MSEHATLSEAHKLTTAERHAIHRQKMWDHREQKAERREEHKRRHFYRSTPPNTLI